MHGGQHEGGDDDDDDDDDNDDDDDDRSVERPTLLMEGWCAGV